MEIIDEKFVNEVKTYKENKKSRGDKEINNKKSINNSGYIPKFCEYDSFLTKKLKVSDLVFIQSHYKIKSKKRKRKQEMIDDIFNFLRQGTFCTKIQKVYRGHLIRKLHMLHGPALYDTSTCINDSDFFSLEELSDINFQELISFEDPSDGKIYGFKVNSLYKLYYSSIQKKQDALNPYTRNKFPNELRLKLMELMRISKIYNLKVISDEDLKPLKLTKKQRFEQRVTNIFNTIDSLGNYTQVSWFFEMNTNVKHVRFIRELYDIWSYRAQLTQSVKNNICNFMDPFNGINLNNTLSIPYDILSNISLTLIEKFVNNGINEESRSLGCYYILTALTLVSPSAAQALPWLYDSVAINH